MIKAILGLVAVIFFVTCIIASIRNFFSGEIGRGLGYALTAIVGFYAIYIVIM